MSSDLERQPLLPRADYSEDDVHDQFCQLVGVPPSDLPTGRKWRAAERSLYERAIRQRSRQSLSYQMTASVANLLLLSQVIIGAAVTGMGAGGAQHIYITLLGAANTIIAGLVAYLKSRGQPMRARMFRDDLERVVDEIENSEIMWLGISKGVNGYDDIDTEDSVTVRSEVARLTRLYDKAVRNHTLNNPDMYGSGEGGMSSAALRNRNVPVATPAPAPSTAPATAAPPAAVVEPEEPTPLAADPDESPATAKPTAPTAVKVVAPTDDAPKTGDADASKADDTKTDDNDKKGDKDGKQDDNESKKDSKEDNLDAGKKADEPSANGSKDSTGDSSAGKDENGTSKLLDI